MDRGKQDNENNTTKNKISEKSIHFSKNSVKILSKALFSCSNPCFYTFAKIAIFAKV